MPVYLDVNLEEVDLSFKLPPVGDYAAQIDSYQIITKDDGSIKYIKFNFLLLSGPEEGVGLKITDNQDPQHEVGKKKMKQLALVCGVEFDSAKIDIEAFVGKNLGIRVVHKPGKNEGTIFANISNFFIPEPPVSG